MRLYKNLSVTALNAEQHAKTCGYWYLVQESCASHCAFATRTGLERWLYERGLTCEIPTAVEPEDYGRGKTNWAPVTGTYGESKHMNTEEFYALPAVIETKGLSNGDYVGVRITEEGGIRVVHTLNPNVVWRKTFDYSEARKEMS